MLINNMDATSGLVSVRYFKIRNISTKLAGKIENVSKSIEEESSKDI